MKIKIISTIIILLIILSVILIFKKKSNTQADQGVPVLITAAKEIALANAANANGNLAANQSTSISPKVSGYITQIFFKEGDTVALDAPLVQLDNRSELDQLAQAQAALKVSQIQYNRNKMLLAKGFITQDIYYNSKVSLDQNQAAVIDNVNKLNDKTIRAPFAGTIGAENMNIGDYVTAGSKLTNLVDSSRLRVEYTLPSNLQNKIALNQNIDVVSETLPNKKFSGKVSYVDASIDPQTQTILLHAMIDNPGRELKPGQFVSITQHFGPDEKSLVVPTQSVLADPNGYSVFVVKDNKAIKIPVVIGQKLFNQIQILKGLQLNDIVVSAGENNLSDNSPVKIMNSAGTS